MPATQAPAPGSVLAQPAQPGAAPGAPGAAEPQVPGLEKPSLLKELPIAGYVLTALSAAGGAVLYWFGGNAQNELKDPSQHTTPDATHSLVVRARVGQVTSYVLFPVTGVTTLWSTISTIRGVLKIAKLAKPPAVTVGAVPVPSGVVGGFAGRF